MCGAAVAAAGDTDRRFELEYRLADGDRRREVLAVCFRERLEDSAPVRSFRFEKGRSSFAGWWWFETTGRHVGFESWLERDHVMLMDFDPMVVGLSSQPFWLHWHSSDGGRARRHAPDFFARRADGTGMVVDVRPDDRIGDSDAEAFAVTARACELVGWDFRRVGQADEVFAVNVRWLSRYRHPRCGADEAAVARLLEVFTGGAPLLAGAQAAGERLRMLPVLFHLVWRRRLVADLAAGPLGAWTPIGVGGQE